ncbi:MAG: hypothetical protein KME26_30430 [Oscillatoria princeps RMCB-10]|jgi:hypothetical protein|nr:hypothetical protein [Oscillatoria princeps RMCB-10]
MKWNNKTMQAGAGERNSTATAAGAGAEGGVVRVQDEDWEIDDLSEAELASIAGGCLCGEPGCC